MKKHNMPKNPVKRRAVQKVFDDLLFKHGYTSSQIVLFGVGVVGRKASSKNCRITVDNLRKGYPGVAVLWNLGRGYDIEVYQLPVDLIKQSLGKDDDTRLTVKATKNIMGWEIEVPLGFVKMDIV